MQIFLSDGLAVPMGDGRLPGYDMRPVTPMH